jgi:hypothetical protein
LGIGFLGLHCPEILCALEPQPQNQPFSHALCPFVAVMEKIREHVRSNFTGSLEKVAEDVKHEVEKLVESSKMDKFMRDKHRQLRELLAGDDWLRRFRFRADVTSSDFHPRCVTFNRFHKEIWVGDQGILAKLRSKHDASLVNQLSPIIVFSNIRTFIKVIAHKEHLYHCFFELFSLAVRLHNVHMPYSRLLGVGRRKASA